MNPSYSLMTPISPSQEWSRWLNVQTLPLEQVLPPEKNDDSHNIYIPNGTDGTYNDASSMPDISDKNAKSQIYYLTGWRLHSLTFCLCLSLLLSAIESTIVSTALPTISNELNSFADGAWIVHAYMLTYSGFLIISARLSDCFGRKLVYMVSLLLFTVFSAACGAVQTMTQLKTFRALQGIGGSGIYSLVMIITAEMVPMTKYGIYTGLLGSVFVVANIMGPALGGVICDNTTWRWIFLMNAPLGGTLLVLLFFIMPSSFPYSSNEGPIPRSSPRRLDLLGCFISTAASIWLVFALQQGGTHYPWNSAMILASLIVSGVLWIVFVVWEHLIEIWRFSIDALIPERLVRQRLYSGILLNSFFSGLAFLIPIVFLPQKYQIVNAAGASEASLRLVPLLASLPIAGITAGILTSSLSVPPLYLIFASGVLQVGGFALMSSTTFGGGQIWNKEIAFEIMIGLGLGLNSSSLLMILPLVVEEKDKSIGIAAMTQLHVLGTTVGLAVASTIFNNRLLPELKSFLSPEQINTVLESVDGLATLTPANLREMTLSAFSDAYRMGFVVASVFAIVSLVTTAALIERQPRKVMKEAGFENEKTEDMSHDKTA